MFLNDIARYADVQDRLRQEINARQAEIGGEDAAFTQEDYDSMSYLNAVLKVGLHHPRRSFASISHPHTRAFSVICRNQCA
jgi:hypothetical protein